MIADAGRPATDTTGAYAWYVALVLALVHLVSACDRYLMGIVIVPLKDDLGLSDTQLGLLAGAGFAILYCIASVPLGLMIDRANRVRMLAAGLAVWTLATGASAFASSFGGLLAARVFVGLGEAVAVPAGMSIIGAYFLRAQVGRATGLFLMGGSLGKIVAFVGGGALLSWLSARGGLSLGLDFRPWQALFLAAAAIGLPALLLLVASVREPPRKPSAVRAGFGETLRHIAHHRRAYGAHVLAGSCAWLVANIYSTWAPSFFVRTFGIDVAYGAFLAGTVSLVSSPIGYFIGGAAMDWMKGRGMRGAPGLIIAAALILSASACLAFTSSASLAGAIAGYAVAQMAGVMGGPPALAGVQMLTPEPQRGLTVALFFAIASLSSLAIGPTVIGLINDVAFDGRALGAAMAITAVTTALIGLPVALASRRSFDRTAEAVAD